MNTSIVAGSLLAALSLVTPLHAQQVAANVVVRSGPVAGHVVIGDRYSSYRRPVVVYRRAPERVIVVERVEVRHHRPASRWRKDGFRQVTLYYVDGRYYDRYDRRRPGMREVIVYERNGRYYQECDDDRHEDRGRHERRWDD
jgi:hypothetical protein